jgi:hypothetical protein
MSNLEYTKNKDLAQQILAYLLAHPNAEDTVAGVAEWWLFQQRIMMSIEDVKTALCWLVSAGYVVEQSGAGIHLRYRINLDKYDEIHSIIAPK